MIKYIVKRLLLIIPVMFAVSFIVFTVLRLGPVDPAQAYLLNSRIPPTEEALAVTRAELGLNKPFFTQYALWLKGAVQLDFGMSYMINFQYLSVFTGIGIHFRIILHVFNFSDVIFIITFL